MILVDTSVWVEHFRKGDAALAELLRDGGAVTHPFVVGELACGNFRNRTSILSLLDALPAIGKAEDGEAVDFIARHKLMGKGLGFIDVHLLAACVLAGVVLWTRDKVLAEAAGKLGCGMG